MKTHPWQNEQVSLLYRQSYISQNQRQESFNVLQSIKLHRIEYWFGQLTYRNGNCKFVTGQDKWLWFWKSKSNSINVTCQHHENTDHNITS